MRVYTKLGGYLYEGKTLRKRDTNLREDNNVVGSVDNDGKTPGEVVNLAKKVANKASNVDTVNVGHAEGFNSNTTEGGKGTNVVFDMNDSSVTQKIDKLTKNPEMKNADIYLQKGANDGSGMINNSRTYTKDTIYEMRRSGVRFSKKEFNDFLNKL